MSQQFDLMRLSVDLVAQSVSPQEPEKRLEAVIAAYKKMYRTIETYFPEKD